MPPMVVAVVVIAAKVAGVRLEAAAALVEVAAMEAASESAAAESASVEAAAAAYKGAAAKPAATATATMAAATAAAAARIGANGRQGQSADHEKSGKRSFDRCTHDNLSFYAHQHCRCSRQNRFCSRADQHVTHQIVIVAQIARSML
jgi:hypothetical protein